MLLVYQPTFLTSIPWQQKCWLCCLSVFWVYLLHNTRILLRTCSQQWTLLWTLARISTGSHHLLPCVTFAVSPAELGLRTLPFLLTNLPWPSMLIQCASVPNLTQRGITMIVQNNQVISREVVENPSHPKLNQFYSACTDMDTINQRGTDPLMGAWNRIDQVWKGHGKGLRTEHEQANSLQCT